MQISEKTLPMNLSLKDNETALVKKDLLFEFKGRPEDVKVFLWDGFLSCPQEFSTDG